MEPRTPPSQQRPVVPDQGAQRHPHAPAPPPASGSSRRTAPAAAGETVVTDAGAPTVRVGGLVVHDGRILLVRQRRAAEPDAPDYWLLPGGGVEFGETLAAALVREAGEELGVLLVPRRPIAVIESISPDPGYRKHVVHVVVLADLADPAMVADLEPRDADVLEARFFTAGELDGLRLRPPFADDLRRFLAASPTDVEYLGRRW